MPRAARSPAVERAQKLLQAHPQLTPAELSQVLQVTPAYARSLLKQAQKHRSTRRTAGRVSGQSSGKSAPLPAPVREAVPGLEDTLEKLNRRLSEAEQALLQLRSARNGSSEQLAADRRVEIIRRVLQGESPESVARSLQITPGEVQFTLKIHRIVNSQAEKD